MYLDDFFEAFVFVWRVVHPVFFYGIVLALIPFYVLYYIWNLILGIKNGS
jgi:hypothetical protein